MTEQQGIPEHALARLAGLRRERNPGGVFTSDFSVNEFLLVRKAGFEPIGLCVGSCIYHLGFQVAGWGSNVELDVLSTAMYEARALAMERMRQEAANMGADGIVGVRLTVKRMEWDSKVLEFVAIGTGIVHAKGHAGFKGPKGQPFTSALSGQDFWTLLQAGYRPLEMVMGSCVYHVARRGPIASMGSIGQNVELTNFSVAFTRRARSRWNECSSKRPMLEPRGSSAPICTRAATVGRATRSSFSQSARRSCRLPTTNRRICPIPSWCCR